VSSWRDEEKVVEYVRRMGRVEQRRVGEAHLADVLPAGLERVLDLGCGDGVLIARAMEAHPTVRHALGLDSSEPMLRRARERFADDARVALRSHDLNEPLPEGSFDAVLSGFAIHHLPHERKRALFGEIAERLRPGGVFANLEVVECATPALQAEFYACIGRVGGDPEDVLADVASQLAWMREAGLVDVDCFWRWRGFALLVGHLPAAG
jgi:SAM-dependent methyltransferase